MTAPDERYAEADTSLDDRMTDVDAAPSPQAVPELDVTNDVDAGLDLARIIDRRTLPGTFSRGGVVVEVVEGDGAPQVFEVDPSALRRLVSRSVRSYRWKAGRGDNPPTQTPTLPPVQVCKDVLSARAWPGLRDLRGVIRTPVLRPDRTLVQTPGYDEATGLLYSPALDLAEVPAVPDEAEVAEAREFVLDTVLGDFPWVDTADKANNVALLVSPILAHHTGALSPLGAITAATAGTGKTLLAGDLPEALFGLTSRPWVPDEGEVRKAVSAVLAGRNTSPVVLFDNVPEYTSVDSATLAKLLTSRQWDDRELGTSREINGINDRLWMVTGNSMSFGGDIPSRTVLVRLDANTARPDLRSGFKIPDLNAWLTDPENAARLMRALLVLVADWAAAGARREPFTMRQFTPWASAAGGFLAHHGVHGLLGNAVALQERDDEGAMWFAFAHEWFEHFGDAWKLPIELAQSAERPFGILGGSADPWHGHFLTDARGNPASPVALGRKLKSKRGAFFGGDSGYRLEWLPDKRTGSSRYRVIPAAQVAQVPLVDETT